MKKIFTLLLIGILVSSCSNDDDEGIDCSLFDPAFPEIYIRIVDETGANLLENGTIDPENITVEGDFSNPGFRFNPPNEYAGPDSEIRKYDNTLSLYIPYESEFDYIINLDESTTIVLEFEAKLAELPCDVSFFIPTKLTFNSQNIESENEESDLIFLAEIEI
ncbi:hypothetical protein [Leeuwenhoekiella blandensis]|uniref:Uncharacterized protein n=1 Tax=Leeuwenhoekiella blandensis (strain CECT 7118 / CCUG 51940 / KCTC 22103 / MED217) TaxID=398720 RepID=A3XIB6_LEEBM|nr:hypothetical protein [Leeuwenhoekiella blandensis]EAQ50980.1 hypothetical protein MED217_15595 [Leeuwenhoekiella blandensis MED217]|tara:strand:+ start:537 stop:1025 length:489 start_codon:yes stop_codon:yes gene_type:complete